MSEVEGVQFDGEVEEDDDSRDVVMGEEGE